MTKAEEQQLHTFETRVRQLILAYKKLQETNRQLKSLCEQKDQALKDAEVERDLMREDYERLKLAKMVEISNEDLAKAKSRVEKLVRKVDKCIALMGV